MPDKNIIVDHLIDIWQEKGIEKFIPSQGKSMYPLIKEGDQVLLKFIKPDNVKVGDIIAFKRNKDTIVHRLLKKETSVIIEKGDLQTKGTQINEKQIIAKVETNLSLLSRIMAALGLFIHKVSLPKPLIKPLLIIPFIINAGTRLYFKLRQNQTWIKTV